MSNCTVMFAAGAASTWTVPSNVFDVKVTVAAGAGGTNIFGTEPTIAQQAALKAAAATPKAAPQAAATTTGGAGGTVTVDLGTTEAGQTLHVLAGKRGTATTTQGQAAPGGGGSYVATAGHLLVAAGGGGGQGDYYVISTDSDGNTTFVNGTQQGGSGGFSTATANGGAGVDVSTLNNAGTGATGATPGHATTTANTAAAGGTGTLTTVAADGTIAAGQGGAAGEFEGFPVASGGGGYAGGGGGSAADTTSSAVTEGAEDAAPGGGGSGYLATGLKAAAVAPNTGDGYVTFTYTLRPTITATSSTVVAGNTGTTTVSGLPAGQALSLRLAGTTSTVYTGTAGADGTATVTFTIPKTTTAGSYRLDVVIGGVIEAVSTPITVTVPTATTVTAAATGTTELAFTGSTLPWWLLPAALLSIAGGIALTRLRRRA